MVSVSVDAWVSRNRMRSYTKKHGTLQKNAEKMSLRFFKSAITSDQLSTSPTAAASVICDSWPYQRKPLSESRICDLHCVINCSNVCKQQTPQIPQASSLSFFGAVAAIDQYIGQLAFKLAKANSNWWKCQGETSLNTSAVAKGLSLWIFLLVHCCAKMC